MKTLISGLSFEEIRRKDGVYTVYYGNMFGHILVENGIIYYVFCGDRRLADDSWRNFRFKIR